MLPWIQISHKNKERRREIYYAEMLGRTGMREQCRNEFWSGDFQMKILNKILVKIY